MKYNIHYRKTLLPLLSVVAVIFSCAKPLPAEDPDAPSGTSGLVNVVFSLSGDAGTKMVDVEPSDETRVSRYVVFVFDTESNWFSYKVSSSGKPVTVQLRGGRDYHCYALVNYPSSGVSAINPAGVTGEADVPGKVAYLSDNRVSSLLMFGKATATVSLPDEEEQVVGQKDGHEGEPVLPTESRTISVHRLVSRIDVPEIAVDFTGKEDLEGKEFILKGIYMTNVYRTARYGSDYTYNELSSSRSAWYNGGGWHLGDVPDDGMDELVGDRDINCVLKDEMPYDVEHSFYVFPNVTTSDNDEHQMGVWSKRCTRLVIEASLDGKPMYYQISIPSMIRNRVYSIDGITITGPGSDVPEDVSVEDMKNAISYKIQRRDNWEKNEDNLD